MRERVSERTFKIKYIGSIDDKCYDGEIFISVSPMMKVTDIKNFLVNEITERFEKAKYYKLIKILEISFVLGDI